MQKTIILPILSVIAIALQLIFGITIPDEVINDLGMAIANIIAVSLTVYGIVKNHKKDPSN